MGVANARRRTYPMKSFDILVDVVSDTWLKSQFPRAPSHTKERAIGGVGGTGTDGTRITQRTWSWLIERLFVCCYFVDRETQS
jgi:hypothetical protein